MRVKKYYSVPALMRLYKAHVLPYVERTTPAIFHSHPNSLLWLDRIQDDFLEELQVSKRDALLNFNLAPLTARRSISMLGLLHRTQLGIAPPMLSAFFPSAKSTMYNYSVGSTPCHNRQIACYVGPKSPVCFRRSIFGLVRVYNKLPTEIVAAPSTSIFQHRLQAMLKTLAKDDAPNWFNSFKLNECLSIVVTFPK